MEEKWQVCYPAPFHQEGKMGELFLKDWRIKRGMTRSALARLSGVSRQTIILIEDGVTTVPTRPTLRRLARILRCDPTEFLAPPPADLEPVQVKDR